MNEEKLLKIFSKNLKRIMKEENITQNELAKEICVNQSVVSRYVTGENLPGFLTAVKIADVLFCSVDDLITEK